MVFYCYKYGIYSMNCYAIITIILDNGKYMLIDDITKKKLKKKIFGIRKRK